MITAGNDILSDYQKEAPDKTTLYAVCAIYALQIIAFLVYFLWPFGKSALSRVMHDSELHLLSVIFVLYPLIALTVLSIKGRLGWALIVFACILNICYAMIAYGQELLSGDSITTIAADGMIYFFLVYVVLIFLLLRKSLLKSLNVGKKLFRWVIGTSVTIGMLFLILLALTY